MRQRGQSRPHARNNGHIGPQCQRDARRGDTGTACTENDNARIADGDTPATISGHEQISGNGYRQFASNF